MRCIPAPSIHLQLLQLQLLQLQLLQLQPFQLQLLYLQAEGSERIGFRTPEGPERIGLRTPEGYNESPTSQWGTRKEPRGRPPAIQSPTLWLLQRCQKHQESSLA